MESEETPLPPRRRIVVILVAFAVFAAPAIVVWGLGRSDDHIAQAPDDGYAITFPDEARAIDNADAEIVAQTNLPEGTLVWITTTSGGSCCPAVEHGAIVYTTQNSTCFGLVGDTADSEGFDLTITVQREFDIQFPGPMLAGEGESGPQVQPDSVLAVLGEDFEHLTGDQVVEHPDGSRALVATARFGWPEPQCGGDQLPLFGGPDCEAQEGQLQGGSLDEAMGEVMGALAQARMCEFWGLMLPAEVEAEHPWPEFAAEWREWYLNPPKDFSDAFSDSTWSNEPFTWHVVEVDGDRHVVEVTHHGEPMIRLDLLPMPDYCPSCDAGVVPFWGVVAWQLY